MAQNLRALEYPSAQKFNSNIAGYIFFTVTKSRSKNKPQRTCWHNTGNDHKCFGGGPVRLAFIFWWELTPIFNINIFQYLAYGSEFTSLLRFWYSVLSKRYLPTACVGVLCCSFYWHFLPFNRHLALWSWRTDDPKPFTALYLVCTVCYVVVPCLTCLPFWSYIYMATTTGSTHGVDCTTSFAWFCVTSTTICGYIGTSGATFWVIAIWHINTVILVPPCIIHKFCIT